MTRKQRRLTMIGGSLTVLAVAAALVLNAMRDSVSAAWCSRARWCAATIWR
jgi:cytochrome c-type biogenesis protein CcmE